MEQPATSADNPWNKACLFAALLGATDRVVIAEPRRCPGIRRSHSARFGIPAASQTVPLLALPMQWSQALKHAPWPLWSRRCNGTQAHGSADCGGGAGFFAVAFYRRNAPGVLVGAGAGARLGALCGLFCAAMTAVLAALRVAALREEVVIRRLMLDAVQQTAARYSDPQFQPHGFFALSCRLVL